MAKRKKNHTMREDIKLVLLDMDGTLCDENGQVCEEFYSFVSKMRKKDMYIGIASGRNGGTIQACFKECFDQMVCISSNGTVNYVNGNVISIDYLDKDVVQKLIQKDEEIEECALQLFYPDKVIVHENNPIINVFEKAGFQIETVQNLYEYRENVVLVSTIDLNENRDLRLEFAQILGSYKMAQSGYGCIDYMPSHVSKAYGAKKICEFLNINLNQVMAIGDAENDLELLEIVGCPVAMKNGIDEIKRVAKYITSKTNMENGCIEFLKEFFEVD